jgi:hypothetical protein
MKRTSVVLLHMVAGLALGVTMPAPVGAQLLVHVALAWELGEGGWKAHGSIPAPREVVYHAAGRRLYVPPGHLPPPGSCRLWSAGTSPGHQPPPQPCGLLLASGPVPGAAILVGAPSCGRGGVDGRGRGRPRGRKC